jgi:type I restriction enzyme S subunit
VLEIPLPLPPLAEQKRIVAKVEQLLARVNAARDRLDRVPAILKRFRHSVLAAACSGRLTKDWRERNPDVEPASVLLERIHNDVIEIGSREERILSDQIELEPYELPTRWSWSSVKDVCVAVTDGDHQPPPKAKGGVPFIVISNISSGSIDLSATMFVPKEYYDALHDGRRPRQGDILYSVTGSFGIAMLVKTREKFCFQRHIALLRPHSSIPSSFLHLVMSSNLAFSQAASLATGIAQPTVPLSGLRVIRIPIPPLAEQDEIVRRVESLFTLADAIERRVAAGTLRAEKITQSVLAKAFRGELVPTEAELARREGRDYEPASVLLERIKATHERTTTRNRKPAGQRKKRG